MGIDHADSGAAACAALPSDIFVGVRRTAAVLTLARQRMPLIRSALLYDWVLDGFTRAAMALVAMLYVSHCCADADDAAPPPPLHIFRRGGGGAGAAAAYALLLLGGACDEVCMRMMHSLYASGAELVRYVVTPCTLHSLRDAVLGASHSPYAV